MSGGAAVHLKGKAWRDAMVTNVQTLLMASGGHLPHEGRAWSACLACRLERMERDLRDSVILSPADKL